MDTIFSSSCCITMKKRIFLSVFFAFSRWHLQKKSLKNLVFHPSDKLTGNNNCIKGSTDCFCLPSIESKEKLLSGISTQLVFCVWVKIKTRPENRLMASNFKKAFFPPLTFLIPFYSERKKFASVSTCCSLSLSPVTGWQTGKKFPHPIGYLSIWSIFFSFSLFFSYIKKLFSSCNVLELALQWKSVGRSVGSPQVSFFI